MSEHGCDTCGHISAEACGHRCVPPANASDPGVDEWIPRAEGHYTEGRHWTGRAWEFEMEARDE